MHSLALELGMTVRQLLEEMDVEEFVSWLRFYQQRGEEPEEELQELSPEALMAAFGGS